MKDLDKKLLSKGLGCLFIDMFNNQTNSADITICCSKFIVDFKILLTDVKENKHGKTKKSNEE